MKTLSNIFLSVFVTLVFGIGLVRAVSAAELIFTADYTVDLSSPDVNLTIISGSEADTLTVETGYIQITVASGDSFSVSSAERNLNVTGETTSTVSSSCVNGVATVTITGGGAGETITITPTSSQCVTSSGRTGGSGGSVPADSPLVPGGSTSATTSTTTIQTTISPAPSTADCTSATTFSPTTGAPCPQTTAQTTVTTTTTTIAPTPFIFTRDLFFGLQNDPDVAELQKRLTTEGCYFGTVTGNFDEPTRAAVRCFQMKYRFTFSPASGFVGPYTRKVLNEGVSVSAFVFTRNLTVGNTGPDITALQSILIAKGFLKITAPTGYFGPLTMAAVAAWQASVGLPSTGFFGPLSRAKIVML